MTDFQDDTNYDAYAYDPSADASWLDGMDQSSGGADGFGSDWLAGMDQSSGPTYTTDWGYASSWGPLTGAGPYVGASPISDFLNLQNAYRGGTYGLPSGD